MIKFLLLTFSLLFLNNSFSQSAKDFTYATTDTKGANYYIYIEKVKPAAKEVWIKKSIPIKTSKDKKGKSITTGGENTLQLVVISCTNSRYDIKQVITYNKNNEITHNEDFTNYENTVIPVSVLSDINNLICLDKNAGLPSSQ